MKYYVCAMIMYLQNELRRLKVPPIVTEDDVGEKSHTEPFDLQLAAKLPDVSYRLNLHEKFSHVIMEISGTKREIAKDARLMNFALPKLVNFEFVFTN